MMKKLLAALAAVLLVASQVLAASTLAVTVSNPGRQFTKYSLAWVSHTDGTVSNAFATAGGNLVQFKFVPDGGGTQPTNLYDVTILDADGFDILAGGGADLSNVNKTLTVATSVRFIERGSFTLTIANAGISKGGTVVLFFN